MNTLASFNMCARLRRIALSGILLLAASTAGATPPQFTDRPTMLVLGDSNIFESFGKELERDFLSAGFKVIRRGKPTSGLARPDFYDWLVVGGELIDRYRPDVVLIMFGGNDGQRLEPYPGTGGTRIKWDREMAWRAEYTRRVKALAWVLGSEGARVFVLSPTNRRSRKAVERMQRVMACQKEALSDMRFATWVDTWTPSTGHNGRYLRKGTDPLARHQHWRSVRYRRGDGIHLTRAGAADLREKVAPVLREYGVIAW